MRRTSITSYARVSAGGNGWQAAWLRTMRSNAASTAGSAEPQKYLPALKAIKYQGASGNVEFDEKGDRKNAALTLYTFKAGQRVKLAVIR